MGKAAVQITHQEIHSSLPTVPMAEERFNNPQPVTSRPGSRWGRAFLTVLFVGVAFGAGWMAATTRLCSTI